MPDSSFHQPESAETCEHRELLSDLYIDQNNRGVVSQSIEDNLLSVRCDVKRAHCRSLRQVGQAPNTHRGQVKHSEILPRRRFRSLHVNQAPAIRHKPDPLSLTLRADVRHLQGSSIGRRQSEGVWAGVHDYGSIRRPYRVSSDRIREPDWRASGNRNLEQPLPFPVIATRDNPMAVRRPICGTFYFDCLRD